MIHSVRLLALAGATALAASGTAVATTPMGPAAEPATRMTKAVDSHVFESVLRLLSPPDSMRLVMVARQHAIALNCDGYEIDWDKRRTVLNDVVAALTKLTKEGENNLPVDVVMAGYNMSLGGQMAVAAYDKKAYCDNAATLRDGLEGDTEGKVSIWKATN